MNYVFDVDGTLTPSREKIDSYFEQFFIEFCSKNSVYLVTGSDYNKTEEQLGYKICSLVKGIFNCSGNVMYRYLYVGEIPCGLEEVYRNDFELLDSEKAALENELRISGFTIRTGNHIEKRIGAVNFSIVGRNANKEQREQYKIWDENLNERKAICDRLNNMFSRLDCVVGGETGIDIYKKDMNKSQVREHIEGPITFFGDRCERGGNDYPLAILADKYYNVKNWEETEYILRMEYNVRKES